MFLFHCLHILKVVHLDSQLAVDYLGIQLDFLFRFHGCHVFSINKLIRSYYLFETVKHS